MKRRLLLWTAILVLLVFGLCPVATSVHATPRPALPQAPGANPAAMKGEGQERHPQIVAAKRALENARRHLQAAKHDFGGHRVKALELTDQAIRECEEALRYDQK
jgi:hypothetical protein